MAKIKINITNGSVQEKPLISAFSVNDSNYVILDNEVNGSMGLPIILISKLADNKLLKIEDQNEWQNIKEQLKNIIAGHKLPFIKVSEELSGDEVYYNQLTLPVASFDILKSSYIVENDNTPSLEIAVDNTQVEQAPVTETPPMDVPAQPADVAPDVSVTPTAEEISPSPVDIAPVTEPIAAQENVVATTSVSPETPTPVVDISLPETPATPEVQNVAPTEEVTPVIDVDIPIVNTEPVESTTPSENIAPAAEPIITPTPVIDSNIEPNLNNTNIFGEQKEAFLQACENMFDALVQKFEREMENRK